jgi:hypothetical protein
VSDVAAVALITGVITAIVGLAGLAANIWNSQKDRELRLEERQHTDSEWYKRALFEKRLHAAQEAYNWLMKFNRGLNLADPKDSEAEWNQRLRTWTLEARECYDSNALFLYGSLPQSSEFIGLINTAAEVAMGRSTETWKQYLAADKEIRGRLDEVLNTGVENAN